MFTLFFFIFKKNFYFISERFMGRVNISNITSSSATLQWEEGPGNIDNYRLEATSLKGSWKKTKDKLKNLSDILDELTPGTGYKIQVFPVKCDRNLNPQNGSFYTSKFLWPPWREEWRINRPRIVLTLQKSCDLILFALQYNFFLIFFPKLQLVGMY